MPNAYVNDDLVARALVEFQKQTVAGADGATAMRVVLEMAVEQVIDLAEQIESRIASVLAIIDAEVADLDTVDPECDSCLEALQKAADVLRGKP